MFADWTDPHDIDNYYADVGKIFSKVIAYADPSSAIPEPQTHIETIEPVVQSEARTVTPVTPVVKSEFEVTPNSIFIDGHPVGSQPEYNILRSGPPNKDTYTERYREMHGEPQDYWYRSHEYLSTCDMWMSLMWIIIIVLFVQVIRLNATMRANQIMFETLLSTLGTKKDTGRT